MGLILKCIYNNNLIRSKTVSYFNNRICNQVNRVSMESPFAPDLASILKTELENRIFKKLFDQRYQSCVWDILNTNCFKPKKRILICYKNPFKKNMKSTFDTFPDEKVHFFDSEIVKNNTNVYHKPRNTGQYINFYSHTSWALITI